MTARARTWTGIKTARKTLIARGILEFERGIVTDEGGPDIVKSRSRCVVWNVVSVQSFKREVGGPPVLYKSMVCRIFYGVPEYFGWYHKVGRTSFMARFRFLLSFSCRTLPTSPLPSTSIHCRPSLGALMR